MNALHTISKITIAALFIVPFTLPDHAPPITSFQSEWWAILLGLFALVPWLFAREPLNLHIPRLVWLLLGMAGLVILQIFLGRVVYPSQGWLTVFYLFWAILLMLASQALVEEQGRTHVLDTLAWAILVGGLFNAVIGIFQAFDFHTSVTDLFFSYGSAREAFGNIGQKNNFADYLSIAFAAVLYLGHKNKLHWSAAMFFGLILLLGLALSGSRSVWLYLIAILILAVLLHTRQSTTATRHLIWGLVLTFAVFQSLQMLLAIDSQSTGINTANSRLQETSESLPVRLALWQDALRMFVSEPWLGVGFQNHAWHHFELVRSGQSLFSGLHGYGDIRWNHAHNIVLHLMAEFGFAAIVLMIGAAWWLFHVMRAVTTIEQWWLATALAIISIHSLLEYPLWYANFLGVFVVLAALAEHHSMVVTVPSRNIRRLSWFIFVLGISLLTFFYLTYTALQNAMVYVTSVNQTPAVNRDFKHVLNIAQMNPFLDPKVDNLISQLPAIDARQLTFIQLQLNLNEKVIHHGGDADPVFHRTTLLWLSGQHQESKRWLIDAAKAYPGSIERYMTRTEYMFNSTPELFPLLNMIRDVQVERQAQAIE